MTPGPGNDAMSTTEVARELGVTDGTVRRYITSGVLPEPGWARQGRKRARQYSRAWLNNAKKVLGVDESSVNRAVSED